MSEDITEQEAQNLLRQFNESKANMHSFFTNVVKADDTLRTGNLSEEELGLGHLPVRTYEELSVFSKEICSQNEWADYFKKIRSVQTDSSLSKDGFLMKLAVTSKKELADTTPVVRKKNKGWFSSKKEPQT